MSRRHLWRRHQYLNWVIIMHLWDILQWLGPTLSRLFTIWHYLRWKLCFFFFFKRELIVFPPHAPSRVCSGRMSQHRVVLPGARPLEDRERLALRIQNSNRVHLRPGVLPTRPRPHPVLAHWRVELEEREAALPGWVTEAVWWQRRN